jgi:hypothetical protein
MPRILAVITNALIRLVGYTILICRSFSLTLGFKYSFYFFYVLKIGWLGFFSGIYFRNSFITVVISLFHGISCFQLHALNFIRNLWSLFRSNYGIHVCHNVQYPAFRCMTVPGDSFFWIKKYGSWSSMP